MHFELNMLLRVTYLKIVLVMLIQVSELEKNTYAYFYKLKKIERIIYL